LVLVTIGLGAAFTASDGSSYRPSQAGEWDPTNESLVGMLFGQLAAVVFGVLAVTGEYASGTIRSSVAALPSRTPLVVAKTIVVGGVMLVLGELIAFVTFGIGQAILSANAPIASLGDPGVFRAVAMAGAYLALISIISIGLGFALRHTAGAITLMVGVLLVGPAVLGALPVGVQESIGRFMPEQMAANSMAAVVPQAHALGSWVSLLLLTTYAILALAVGARLLRRRDV
jgi:hypothetical protein